MSVRKRKWVTRGGEAKEAWVVDYVDGSGKRRLKTFPRKKEADAFAAKAGVEVREGTHVADSASATVAQAGALWLARAKAHSLERATTDTYHQYLAYHIEPFIGGMRLSRFTAPAARAFEDRLRDEGRSPFMVRRVMRTLGSILADAQERGLIVRNVARELTAQRRGRERKSEQRQQGKLKIGVDIPTREEIKAIVQHAKGRWRPLLITAILTGLRASELRGLRWQDVDLKARVLHVRHRADRYNEIGPPKSEAGERTIPLSPLVVSALREWKPSCPAGDAGLVFPSGAGKVESLGNIINRGLKPTQVAASWLRFLTRPESQGGIQWQADGAGEIYGDALATAFLCKLVHQSPCRWGTRAAGEAGARAIGPRLNWHDTGHLTYGHLFPRGDDLAELDVAERALLSGEP